MEQGDVESVVKKDNPRILALEREIDEIKRRWPPHSVPPQLLRRLDELEDELERAKKEG
jgi:hypothetical protein